MPVTPVTTKEWVILERWLPTLRELPEIDLIWLEGSLASGRGNAGSDIDLRLLKKINPLLPESVDRFVGTAHGYAHALQPSLRQVIGQLWNKKLGNLNVVG